jgi:hydroxymethylbilane synthase
MTADAALLETPVRIGTRGSDLAMWQTNHVSELLRRHFGPDLKVEIVQVVTEGDRVQDRPLHEIGGKGLFVKGIEEKLLAGDVDLAVHSMKDLPARTPPGLEIACTPAREDPRDALVGPAGASVATLPPGTRLGTGSLRRGALVRRINPRIEVVPLRGNVPTRVRRVDDGHLDAILLAAAGLRRLGMHDRIVELLDPDLFCPAPAQGVLALQCRSDDDRMKTLLQPLRDASTAIVAEAERAFLQRLEAGCTVPVGCHARLVGSDRITVRGIVIDPTGDPLFEATLAGEARSAADLGTRIAETLLSQGADRIVGSSLTQPPSG